MIYVKRKFLISLNELQQKSMHINIFTLATPVLLGTWEAEIRIMVWAQPGKIVQEIPISKNKQSKMDWRSDSSGRAPALQIWSLEFKA
jgi:hypothetical protein